MGCEKTLNRVMARFYWPGIWADVRRWCTSCPECQLVNQPAIPRAPLLSGWPAPLPLMKVPFERIGIGPHRAISLERTRISLCVSSRGLRNAISGGSAAVHQICKECGAGTVSSYLPSRDPEREPAHNLCHKHWENYTDYWASSQFELVYTTPKRTASSSA